jgi:hypothetical protein
MNSKLFFFFWEIQKEKDHWEDLDVGGRIILISGLEELYVFYGLALFGPG